MKPFARTIDWARAHPPGEFDPKCFCRTAEDAAAG
jgi:hypothetical protein